MNNAVVYQVDLNAIYNSLGRIEATLSSVQETMRADNKRQDDDATRLEARVDAHDRQFNTLNNKIHWWSGVGSALGLVLGWFGKQHFGGGL